MKKTGLLLLSLLLLCSSASAQMDVQAAVDFADAYGDIVPGQYPAGYDWMYMYPVANEMDGAGWISMLIQQMNIGFWDGNPLDPALRQNLATICGDHFVYNDFSNGEKFPEYFNGSEHWTFYNWSGWPPDLDNAAYYGWGPEYQFNARFSFPGCIMMLRFDNVRQAALVTTTGTGDPGTQNYSSRMPHSPDPYLHVVNSWVDDGSGNFPSAWDNGFFMYPDASPAETRTADTGEFNLSSEGGE